VLYIGGSRPDGPNTDLSCRAKQGRQNASTQTVSNSGRAVRHFRDSPTSRVGLSRARRVNVGPMTRDRRAIPGRMDLYIYI